MRFIKLTKKADNWSIWINQDQIVSLVNRDPDPNGGEVRLSTGEVVETVENVAQIMTEINS